VTVGSNTDLIGGIIASKSKDLTLDTGTLTYSDLQDRDKSKQVDGSISIGGALSGGGDKSGNPTDTNFTVEGQYAKKDKEGITRATVGEGEIIIRDKDKQKELEDSGKTQRLANINRDLDLAQEVTKDEETEINLYVSDSSLRTAAKGIAFIGKKIGDVIDQFADALTAAQELTPEQAQKVKKLGKAIDEGEVTYIELVECIDGNSCQFELTGGEGLDVSEEVLGKLLEISIYASENGAELTWDEKKVKKLADSIKELDKEYGYGDKSASQIMSTYGEWLGEQRSDFVRDAFGNETGDAHDDIFKGLSALAALGGETLNAYIDRKAQERGWSQQYTNDLKYITGIGGVVIGSVIGSSKRVNLPSWKKIDIDMGEIVSGHTKGGNRVTSNSKKDLFPENMSEDQIEKTVRQAYRNAEKAGKTQNGRIKMIGQHNGLTIHMYVNIKSKKIETAFPK